MRYSIIRSAPGSLQEEGTHDLDKGRRRGRRGMSKLFWWHEQPEEEQVGGRRNAASCGSGGAWGCVGVPP